MTMAQLAAAPAQARFASRADRRRGYILALEFRALHVAGTLVRLYQKNDRRRSPKSAAEQAQWETYKAKLLPVFHRIHRELRRLPVATGGADWLPLCRAANTPDSERFEEARIQWLEETRKRLARAQVRLNNAKSDAGVLQEQARLTNEKIWFEVLTTQVNTCRHRRGAPPYTPAMVTLAITPEQAVALTGIH